MEPASDEPSVSICGIRMDVSWLDVGSWPSYAETLAADARGNRVAPGTTAVMTDCSNSVAVSSVPGHTLAMLGCEGLIVVHTPDATLVMPAGRAQDLKTLHGELPEQRVENRRSFGEPDRAPPAEGHVWEPLGSCCRWRLR